MCDGEEGYCVRHGGGNIWACVSGECVAKNAKKPSRAADVGVNLVKLSGMPQIYFGCAGEGWLHSPSLRSRLSEWLGVGRGFLVLSGDCGCGKTFAACCLIAEWTRLKGVPARFYDMAVVKQLWYEEIRSTGLKTLSTKLSEAPLLVLDDLSAMDSSDGFQELIYLVINSRYNNMLPTIITTNLNEHAFGEQMGNAISSRVFSKDGRFFEMRGRDMRS
jgi:hypothetical protein